MHSVHHELDLNGFQIRNLAPATLPTDAVILSQLSGTTVVPGGVFGNIQYNGGSNLFTGVANLNYDPSVNQVQIGASITGNVRSALVIKDGGIEVTGRFDEYTSGVMFKMGVGPGGDSARILFGHPNGNYQIDNDGTGLRIFVPGVVLFKLDQSGMDFMNKNLYSCAFASIGILNNSTGNITNANLTNANVVSGGVLKLFNGSSTGITVRGPLTGTPNYSFVLPANMGTSGYFLQTDGSSSSWAAVRQVTTGGNAYEVLTKNPDGTDTYVWRIPDTRSVASKTGDYLNYKLLLMRSTFTTDTSHLIVEATGKFGVSTTANNSGVIIGIDGALVLTTNANDGTGISNTVAERAWTLRLVVTRTGTTTGLAEATIWLDGSTIKTRVPMVLSSQSWTTGNIQIDIQGRNDPDRVSVVRSYFWNAGAASLLNQNTTKTTIPNGDGSTGTTGGGTGGGV